MAKYSFEENFDTEEFMNERTLTFEVRRREFQALNLTMSRIKEINAELQALQTKQAEDEDAPSGILMDDFIFDRCLSTTDRKALQKMIDDKTNPLTSETVSQLWRLLARDVIGLDFPDPKSGDSSDTSTTEEPTATTD